MPTVAAAVFVAGGLPGGDWTDDKDLAPYLRRAASNLDHTHVLMANMEGDQLFPAPGVPSSLTGADLIAETMSFINQHVEG